MRVERLNVGIVGLGQGRAHLTAFQLDDRCRVVAVCDNESDVAERVATEHGIDRWYDEIERLLGDEAIGIVVIATPDHLHGRHSVMALEAGKHVLSEIPMATTIAECERIVALTRDTSLKYHMGNQARYAHCLQDTHRLISEGMLGEIFYGEGEYLHDIGDVLRNRSSPNWRIAPGQPQTTLLGGGPHALDTLRWLMGVRFTSTRAYHATQETEWHTLHTTAALFKADNGAVAKVTVSYGMVRPYCLYYSVYGTKGSFERTRDQGGGDEETTNLYAHQLLPGTSRMTPVRLPNFSSPAIARRLPAARTGHGTMEVEQASKFLDAIIQDTEPEIGSREAAASIVPLICALESASSDGEVTIPEIT